MHPDMNINEKLDPMVVYKFDLIYSQVNLVGINLELTRVFWAERVKSFPLTDWNTLLPHPTLFLNSQERKAVFWYDHADTP